MVRSTSRLWRKVKSFSKAMVPESFKHIESLEEGVEALVAEQKLLSGLSKQDKDYNALLDLLAVARKNKTRFHGGLDVERNLEKLLHYQDRVYNHVWELASQGDKAFDKGFEFFARFTDAYFKMFDEDKYTFGKAYMDLLHTRVLAVEESEKYLFDLLSFMKDHYAPSLSEDERKQIFGRESERGYELAKEIAKQANAICLVETKIALVCGELAGKPAEELRARNKGVADIFGKATRQAKDEIYDEASRNRSVPNWVKEEWLDQYIQYQNLLTTYAEFDSRASKKEISDMVDFGVETVMKAIRQGIHGMQVLQTEDYRVAFHDDYFDLFFRRLEEMTKWTGQIEESSTKVELLDSISDVYYNTARKLAIEGHPRFSKWLAAYTIFGAINGLNIGNITLTESDLKDQYEKARGDKGKREIKEIKPEAPVFGMDADANYNCSELKESPPELVKKAADKHNH